MTLALFPFCALCSGGGHDFFDFIGIAREAFTEQLVAGFDDKDIVFDAHAEILFGDVDAGLNGNDHAGLESGAMVAGVVNVQADGMAEAVDEIGPEGFAMEIFPVRVDVVVGNFLHALVAFAAKIHARLERGEGGVLRAENDFIDLDRKSTRLNSSHEWISYAVFCLKKKKHESKKWIKRTPASSTTKYLSSKISHRTHM